MPSGSRLDQQVKEDDRKTEARQKEDDRLEDGLKRQIEKSHGRSLAISI
jgi:hypothetical protein